MYRWSLTSELARDVKSMRVERSNSGFNFWLGIDTLPKPTTEVTIFLPSKVRLMYQFRVKIVTDVNGTLWQHEIDRSLLHVTAGKQRVQKLTNQMSTTDHSERSACYY